MKNKYWGIKQEKLMDLYNDNPTTLNFNKIDNKIKEIIKKVLYQYYQGQFNFHDENTIINDCLTEMIISLNKNDSGNWYTYISMRAKHILYSLIISNTSLLTNTDTHAKYIKKSNIGFDDYDTDNNTIYNKIIDIVDTDKNIEERDEEHMEKMLIYLIGRKKWLSNEIYLIQQKYIELVNNEKFNITQKNAAAYQYRIMERYNTYHKIIYIVEEFLRKYGIKAFQLKNLAEYFNNNYPEFNYSTINFVIGHHICYYKDKKNDISQSQRGNLLDDYIEGWGGDKYYINNKMKNNPYKVII